MRLKAVQAAVRLKVTHAQVQAPKAGLIQGLAAAHLQLLHSRALLTEIL